MPVLKRILFSVLTAICMLCPGGQEKVRAQEPLDEYQVKAIFLYNFTQFIDWPANSFASTDAPFVIGILGENPFRTFLEETVSGEKVKGHPIVVRRFIDVDDVRDCHVLFISTQSEERLRNILEKLKGRNILTISNETRFMDYGGMIRFFNERNKIKFAINLDAVKSSSLLVSSKLLRVAVVHENQGRK